MEFTLMLRRLWAHRVLVALGILIAALLAVYSHFDVSLSPLSIKAPRTQFGAAQTVMYVDTRQPSLVEPSDKAGNLVARAAILARVIGSGQVRAEVGRRLGVPARLITVTGPYPDQAGASNVQPVAQQRANQVLSQGSPYSIFVDTDAAAPTITLYTQARDGQSAIALGQATVDALSAYSRGLAVDERPSIEAALRDSRLSTEARDDRILSPAERRQAQRNITNQRTVVRQLGQPVGGSIVDQSGSMIAIVLFVGLALAWCVVLLLVTSAIRAIREP